MRGNASSPVVVRKNNNRVVVRRFTFAWSNKPAQQRFNSETREEVPCHIVRRYAVRSETDAKAVDSEPVTKYPRKCAGSLTGDVTILGHGKRTPNAAIPVL